MAEQHLEEQLQEKLRQASDEARAIGYNPNYFVQMLANEGAIGTVNHLLASAQYAQGLTTLWELKALHLSVEAIILREPYCQLFSPEQLKIARTRLTQLKYRFD
jgi:hypothetical protein